ncbi:MAG: hypothetical protein IT449_18770 [Phycisphaerales bacterium]|nr:hypothetical protein [Phycisphaerales bacterium]
MTLMMGVSGIRGIVGQTMTPELVRRAASGFVAFLAGASSRRPLRLLVARDSRPSGAELAAHLLSELAASGCTAIDLGIVSTPCAGRAVRRLACDGGILLTASHNPAQYNGIKFLTAEGGAPDAKAAAAIIEHIHAISAGAPVVSPPSVRAAPPASHGLRAGLPGTTPAGAEALREHVEAVLATVEAERIRAARFHVVLDSVCGAGGGEGLALLEALGCRVTHMGAEPTGEFPHAPEPVEENLTELAETVRRAGADAGFAQDPDADRLAIVDETGRYVGEEYTLALSAMNVLGARPGAAVANLSTSRMIDDVAAAIPGCRVERSAVGEANVVERMRATGAVIGGEGNGGVIDPRIGWIRDSLVAMAQALELMARREQPLSRIVASIPRYEIVKAKLDLPAGGVRAILDRVLTAYAKGRISDVDGVRVDRADGWFHVRGSNTEPILRIIAEAKDRGVAERMIDEVRGLIG